ncbi:MAG: ABC transporter permease [Actinomycetota bacterium]
MNDSIVVLTIAGAVVAGTPLAISAVGEILAERSGVMNLGIEGMMLVGGVLGIVGTLATHNPYVGMLLGATAGAAIALAHAALAISLRVSQVVSGLALVIVGTGLSSFIGRLPKPPLTGRQGVEGFHRLLPGGLADLPIVGPILFRHDPIVYLSWLLVAACSFYLFRTRTGLAARAVGEDPATADAAGIRVSFARYVHTLVGGAFAGLGGGYLTIQLTGIWQDGITAGSGWIAFALVSFSGWRPWRALIAAYVFGALTNLSFTLQLLGVRIPSDLLAALPFIMTILVLMAVSARPVSARSIGAPAALAEPYIRESR